MTCEEIEIALEKRRRGALADDRIVVEHLAGCASCRAYERTIEEMEKMMTTMTTNAAAQLDVAALAERVSRISRRSRRALVRVIVLLPILMPAIVLWSMPAEARTLGWALGGAISAAMVVQLVLERRRFARETAQAASSREDLLALWRRDLDRRIGMLRLWPMNVAAACLLPLPAILDRDHSLASGGAALVYGLSLFMLIQGLYYGLFLLPRLRRERADID